MKGKDKQKQLVLMLGSNKGDRKAMLGEAVSRINKTVGSVTGASSIYETEAWGVDGQAVFLNVALLVLTDLAPEEVLRETMAIESALGRERKAGERYGQRTMDIDILFYGSEVVRTVNLIIPHPAIQDRRFVLEPLNEILPDWVHPVSKITVKNLLKSCSDTLGVKKGESMLKNPKKVN